MPWPCPGCARRPCSAVAEVLAAELRTISRRAAARGHEQADDPAALSHVRLEKLEHAGVVGAGLTGERVRHDVGDVVVAQRHRVRVAVADRGDLRRRPRPDARE
jgi:hypothetical protein